MKPGPTSRTKPAGAGRRPRDQARALFRDGILDAAEAVFAERGFQAARIQDIADHARIAVGTVYNHFEQKEDLLRTLLDERTQELVQRLGPAPDDPVDYGARLTRRLERMLEFLERHRGFFAVASECGLVASPANEEMRALVGHGARGVKGFERFRAAFRAVVQEGIDSGALVPLPAQHVAFFLGGTMRAFVHASIGDPQVPLVPFAASIVHLFLHGAGQAAKAAQSTGVAPRAKKP